MMSYTMDVTYGAGTDHPSGAPEFTQQVCRMTDMYLVTCNRKWFRLREYQLTWGSLGWASVTHVSFCFEET
jgi:hypothetical protein